MNPVFNKAVLIISASFFLLVTNFKSMAQNQPLYSQWTFNGTVINPAWQSIENEYSNLTIMNRQQWVGIPGAPKTTTLTFSYPFSSGTSIGLLAVQDAAGVNTQTKLDLLLSQNINLGADSYLSLGVSGGISILKEDNLSLNAAYDPLFAGNYLSDMGDIGFGALFFTSRFFVGFGAPSFKQITLSTQGYDTKGTSNLYLNCGYLFDISPMIKFKPAVLIKKVDAGPIQAEAMTSFLLNDIIWIGFGWRQAESIIGLAQFQLTNNIKLSYSYDYVTQSALQTIQQGSHELALSFRFGSKGRIVSPSYF